MARTIGPVLDRQRRGAKGGMPTAKEKLEASWQVPIGAIEAVEEEMKTG